MKVFTQHTGLAVPLERVNIDTDAIIPKQFLKSIKRTGFGENLFDEWRYLDHGEPGMLASQRQINPDFVLNHPRYQGATILLSGKNFGCGSSREHAPWALQQYGFRAVIAPSFADIFFNNCYKNGLLPIVLDERVVRNLMDEVKIKIGHRIAVDLVTQRVINGDSSYPFQISDFRKYCLVNGFDEIALSLRQTEKIKAFEKNHIARFPWLATTLAG